MLDLIAAAGIGGIIGAGIMAWRTHRKVADHSSDVAKAEANRDHWLAQYDRVRKEIAKHVDAGSYQSRLRLEAEAAHTRCADALTTKERKLSAIRDLVGPTEGLRRGRLGQIAAILDGERA